MILDRLPPPLLRFTKQLYQQQWYHWFASLVLGFWDTVFGVIYRVQDRVFRISLWESWQNRSSPQHSIPVTGSELPVRSKRSDASGLYIATIVGTYADGAELQRTLPPDAALDPAQIRDGKHAIVLMFGYTQNLHRVWNPLPGINYMEFAVGIPSVRIKREAGYDFPFFYLPTLYLSRLYPVLMGWLVGYRKHWGWVYGQDKTYEVATLGGRKILSAKFDAGSSSSLVTGGSEAAPWREFLDQPHSNPLGHNDFSICSFGWTGGTQCSSQCGPTSRYFARCPDSRRESIASNRSATGNGLMGWRQWVRSGCVPRSNCSRRLAVKR